MSFTYIIPITYDAKDNETIINKRLYKIKECVVNDPNSITGMFNENRCKNDDCFCNPFVSGDKLYFQFILNSIVGVTATVRNPETDEAYDIEDLVTYEEGYDNQEVLYRNIIIDTGATGFDAKCFYIEIQEYASEYVVSRTRQTEPFCEVSDCLQKTMLFKGEYTAYDCNGNYHGEFADGSTNSYRAQLRIPGEIFQEKFAFEETLLNRVKKRSRQLRVYTLLTPKVPPYVVEYMALCFNSKTLTIDGVEYMRGVELSKNFEEGSMWIIKASLQRECSELDFSCE